MKFKRQMLRKQCNNKVCFEKMPFTEQKCPKCGNESFSLLPGEVENIIYKDEDAGWIGPWSTILGLIFGIYLCIYFKLAWYHSIWLCVCFAFILFVFTYHIVKYIKYNSWFRNDCKHVWKCEKRQRTYTVQHGGDTSFIGGDSWDYTTSELWTEKKIDSTVTKYCKKCGEIYSQWTERIQ